VKKLVVLLALVLASVALVPVNASAAGPVNLHKVNLRNATIPGSTCHSPNPIKLHKGHGKSVKWHGQHLVVDSYGKPIYGDLTNDGQDEAFLYVLCSTGGGTAASEVRSNWVVFTGGSGQVAVLGVMYPKHQWLNSAASIMSDPVIANGTATVRETIWFTDDHTCCGTGRAKTTWWFHNGALRVKSTTLKITDKIVSSRRVGHAALGMTVAQLKKKYGSVQHEELANGGCDIYWHGKPAKSFGALIDPSSKGKVFGLYAPTTAVTVAGVGHYATIAQIKRVYAGHTIKLATRGAAKEVYVQFPTSWFGFTLRKDSGIPGYYVRSIVIGTHAFVTGKHTCTS
jgi:hypothetical protein